MGRWESSSKEDKDWTAYGEAGKPGEMSSEKSASGMRERTMVPDVFEK